MSGPVLRQPTAEPVADHRHLIHKLNQRYHQQWQRAEQLQAELDAVHHSRPWQWLLWCRRLKQRFFFRKPNPVIPSTSEPMRIEESSLSPTASVSLIVPFRDRPELLRGLVQSLRKTRYRRFELILVDNDSRCPKTVSYITRLSKKSRYRLIHSPGPFHFAKLCNLGARRARGEFLLFLNNDIEITDPDWLHHLLRLGVRDDVGVAGATLLYPDATIQHAGIFPTADATNWEHRHRGRAWDDPTAEEELRYSRAVPAVTGACLMIRRSLFRSVDGFSMQFPVTGNDVDLCLRVRQLGYRVAISAAAQLLHYESLSRGYARDDASRQLKDEEK